ncbi:MAG: ABC transporter ATP-binding protein [Alphaproteobacteria bacterium]|nr:ABC transporter ATP-binding protein [Alphaproteobacteria bacterium]
MRPHAAKLAAAMALMAVVAATSGLYPKLIGEFVDMVTARDETALWLIPSALLLAAILRGLASYGQTVLTMSVAFRIITEMQKAMFAHLMRADMALFTRTPTGRLVSRFTNDVNMLRDAVSKTLTGIARDGLTIVVMAGIMVSQDWQLGLIVVAVLAIAWRPIIRIGKRLRRVSANTQVELGTLTATLNESLGGMRMVKSYRLEEYEQTRADRAFETIYTLVTKGVRGRARTYPITEGLIGVALVVVLALGGYRMIYGGLTIGEFSTFTLAMGWVIQPVRGMGALNASMQEGLAAAHRLFELLDTPPTIVDRPDAKSLEVAGGRVELDNVRFAYGGDTAALDGVSLTVPAGRTVALVGPSGAGKSTVLNLIPRFWDVDGGAVRIDGQDVREVTQASLAEAIALVSQDVTLFDDTIAANIAFGLPGAAQAEIERAARDAAAHDFITALPEGYATIVGERGVRLSGGERQRVAIARAMLKDAPILLLDEATSALDAEAERQVQAALARLAAGRTTLVIAHRLATVVGADNIVVLEGGRIVESGTHAALAAADGLYAHLSRLQFRGDPAVVEPLPARDATAAGRARA